MAAEKASGPKRITEQRFLDHIADGYQAGQRYCFVLGAGAAKASGIRTGEEMMREWRAYLLEKARRIFVTARGSWDWRRKTTCIFLKTAIP